MIANKPIKKRPKNLNLLTIRLPINAVVSIMHRASGVMLFLMLPAVLWVLQQSLASEAQYLTIASGLQHWAFKLILIGLAWAFFHHFFAGIRHLAMDVHWMTSLQKARFSSRVVLGLVGVAVLVFAWCIW
ncbi:succinate dehydrogenase subunit C [Methylophilaceae bacterium 11]|jgi:succinate dehydrogenase / fumarate reductase cytochrome b subunit|uniref:succinate dehydrogenase, cytochrome b556 subunit n=1 Tax=Methylotenera sp. 1P/1 TaxID=1131551 RepID=UPI0003708183|nr:succinate dehydrogenase, cytochrome b556 subunit [Methylotenera sp. 1P/1]EUJ11010.1 succinate dehydrogenase subunit C [Methylophilaceae bacterium 11]